MAIGIIAEYNPLHIGHGYQIKKTKSMAPDEPLVIIQSGYFVQRGEPAIFEPKYRAEAAISAGADLVILLPLIYSIQSAEFFANGAIKFLSKSNIHTLVYGSENPDLKLKNSREDILIEKIKQGHSYASAFQHSLNLDYLDANSRLGFAYQKAINKYNLKIKPKPIKRIPWPNSYVDFSQQNASALRKKLFKNQNPKGMLMKPKKIHSINDYKEIVDYLLIIGEDMNSYPYGEPGLWERIKNTYDFNSTLEKNIINASSKRHTIARICRFLLHILLDIKKEDLELMDIDEDIIIPLAMNKAGQAHLATLRNDVKILSTTKAFHKYVHQNKTPLLFDIKGERLYHLKESNKKTIYSF